MMRMSLRSCVLAALRREYSEVAAISKFSCGVKVKLYERNSTLSHGNSSQRMAYGAGCSNDNWRNKRNGSGKRTIPQWTRTHVALAAVGAAAFTSDDTAQWFSSARNGDVKQIKRLIDAGYDVNSRHHLGWTALMSAVANERVDVVELLLKSGANVNSKERFSGVRETARRLNEPVRAVSDSRDRDFSSHFDNERSFVGLTPLHYAVLVDNLQLVQLLLDNGANPRARNADGHTAVEYAHPDSKQLQNLLREAEANYNKRVPLETRLRGGLVGQDDAIRTVSSAVRRKQGGWHSADRPLVFMFVGSSGIGKTELAKHIASYVHGDDSEEDADEDERDWGVQRAPAYDPRGRMSRRKSAKTDKFERHGFIRIDLSEYGERHEVAKLIGAPPGYVGYEQGGQLTRKLAACPNAVVLLDEVEKAHPDVLNVLLALFDEGRITDSNGQTVHCRDAIFVLTSNLASREIAQYAASQSQSTVTLSGEFKERVVRPILSGHFKRDEFLGRIDEIVYFVPFSDAQLAQLVLTELQFWKSRALRKHQVAISWSDAVVELLKGGYDVHFGARSIKHEVERRLVSLIALAHELGVVKDGAKVHFDVDGTQTLKLLVEKNGSLVDAFDDHGRPAVPTSTARRPDFDSR